MSYTRVSHVLKYVYRNKYKLRRFNYTALTVQFHSFRFTKETIWKTYA